MEIYSRDVVYDKSIILYILNTFKYKLTNTKLTQIILDNNIINYFALQTMISELLDTDLIVSISDDAGSYYAITREGESVSDSLAGDIPETLKHLLNDYMDEHREDFDSLMSAVKSECIQQENGNTIASLRILENRSNLIELNISLPTEDIARQICNLWDENASVMFSEIVDVLTKNR